jgi:large subunit ribosomal protein L22
MKREAQAQLKHLRMGPQKVRLVTGLVRGLNVDEALAQLAFSSKHAARPIKKLLESAIANAEHNHEMERTSLVIKNIIVDGGPVLHRWMPRAHGSASPLRKRSSHITVTLEGETKAITKKKEEKKNDDVEGEVVEEPKKAVKKTTKSKK